ncbi:MAG: hypothetical protein AB8B65_00060 [Kordia sp.]|uniref:hypothetical protein n=1 Tax=Kordia sp. TaxID=1965332 RepID=UPI00385E9547
MNIEFFSELHEDIIPEIIIVDIDENLPIKDLFSKLHDITGIERFIEAVLFDDETEKIACSYYYKHQADFLKFKSILDLEQKISEFPKNGLNGELSIYFNMSTGFIN